MSSGRTPDLTLFLDILRALEDIGAPYVVIGAFAGAMYGATRATYDIDIIVDLREEHIRRLAAAYPLPRYYADPVQMRDSIRLGILFNIIDSTRGEKADLIPLTMTLRYRQVFERRVRQVVGLAGGEALEFWCARPDDVILGKLMAWQQGRSHKHELDIRDLLVAHYLDTEPAKTGLLDEAYLDRQASMIGADAEAFWKALKESAQREVGG